MGCGSSSQVAVGKKNDDSNSVKQEDEEEIQIEVPVTDDPKDILKVSDVDENDGKEIGIDKTPLPPINSSQDEAITNEDLDDFLPRPTTCKANSRKLPKLPNKPGTPIQQINEEDQENDEDEQEAEEKAKSPSTHEQGTGTSEFVLQEQEVKTDESPSQDVRNSDDTPKVPDENKSFSVEQDKLDVRSAASLRANGSNLSIQMGKDSKEDSKALLANGSKQSLRVESTGSKLSIKSIESKKSLKSNQSLITNPSGSKQSLRNESAKSLKALAGSKQSLRGQASLKSSRTSIRAETTCTPKPTESKQSLRSNNDTNVPISDDNVPTSGSTVSVKSEKPQQLVEPDAQKVPSRSDSKMSLKSNSKVISPSPTASGQVEDKDQDDEKQDMPSRSGSKVSLKSKGNTLSPSRAHSTLGNKTDDDNDVISPAVSMSAGSNMAASVREASRAASTQDIGNAEDHHSTGDKSEMNYADHGGNNDITTKEETPIHTLATNQHSRESSAMPVH